MNSGADKQVAAEARYQAAYEDAKLRGFCDIGARDVAWDAMKHDGLSEGGDGDDRGLTRNRGEMIPKHTLDENGCDPASDCRLANEPHGNRHA